MSKIDLVNLIPRITLTSLKFFYYKLTTWKKINNINQMPSTNVQYIRLPYLFKTNP